MGEGRRSLDLPARRAHITPASDGRTAAGGNSRGKSGLHGDKAPGNARPDRPETGELRESAAENEPPSPEGKGEKVR